MINGKERVECEAILLELSSDDLNSLLLTVTNKKIVTTSCKESIDAILDYSSSSAELLGRKKVKRDVLFNYLHKKGERLPTTSDKDTLVQHIVKRCGGHLSEHKVVEAKHLTASSPAYVSPLSQSTSIAPNPRGYVVQEANQTLSQEFVDWFYPVLNGQMNEINTSSWSSDHFTPDCVLECSNNTDTVEQFYGAEETYDKFTRMIRSDRVLFNVNTTPNGHRAVINPHGLAKVAACGTLHQYTADNHSCLVGIFEQLFGLIRDPNDQNRWKIKFSKLLVKLTGNYNEANGLSSSLQEQLNSEL
ncbi:uncharacterized protein C3orf38 homolog [Ciona intestinalis]